MADRGGHDVLDRPNLAKVVPWRRLVASLPPKNRQLPEIIGTLNATEESDTASIQGRIDDVPEFISIAHEAIRHFRISVSANSYPKKEGWWSIFNAVGCLTEPSSAATKPTASRRFADRCRR